MEFIQKTIKIILSVSLILCSGCHLSNEELQTEPNNFHANNPNTNQKSGEFSSRGITVTELAVISDEEITTDGEILFSVSEEATAIHDKSSMNETIPSINPDGEESVKEKNSEEWIWGNFVVPKNWREILTTEEAFAGFDEITAPLPKGASLEDEIVLLMNRNVLCFGIGHLEMFEFIDPVSGLKYSSDEALHVRARSEYFSTIREIESLYKQTYTEDYAYISFYGTEDRPRQEFIKDEDGIIWIDMRCVGNWVRDPFKLRSYIEIMNVSDTNCEFLWHYGGAVDHSDPLTHQQIRCNAVKEKSEWRLTFAIYDNPTYME